MALRQEQFVIVRRDLWTWMAIGLKEAPWIGMSWNEGTFWKEGSHLTGQRGPWIEVGMRHCSWKLGYAKQKTKQDHSFGNETFNENEGDWIVGTRVSETEPWRVCAQIWNVTVNSEQISIRPPPEKLVSCTMKNNIQMQLILQLELPWPQCISDQSLMFIMLLIWHS